MPYEKGLGDGPRSEDRLELRLPLALPVPNGLPPVLPVLPPVRELRLELREWVSFTDRFVGRVRKGPPAAVSEGHSLSVTPLDVEGREPGLESVDWAWP